MKKKIIIGAIIVVLILGGVGIYYSKLSPTSLKQDIAMKFKGCSNAIPQQYKKGQCQSLRDYLNIGDCFGNIEQIDLPKILKDPNCCQQFDDPKEDNNDLDYLCYGEYGEQIKEKKLCDNIIYQDGKDTCNFFFDRKNNIQ